MFYIQVLSTQRNVTFFLVNQIANLDIFHALDVDKGQYIAHIQSCILCL